jgi:hypothetical protein
MISASAANRSTPDHRTGPRAKMHSQKSPSDVESSHPNSMNDRPGSDLFSNFVDAADDGGSEAALEALFAELIEPIISSVLRRKLQVSLSNSDESKDNQDALELAADIRLRLLGLLQMEKRRDLGDNSVIGNFSAYVRAVTTNAYRQFLRDKYPLRLRLKNKIRYVVSNHPDYASWTDANGRFVCGLSGWKDSELPARRPGFEESFRKRLQSVSAGLGLYLFIERIGLDAIAAKDPIRWPDLYRRFRTRSCVRHGYSARHLTEGIGHTWERCWRSSRIYTCEYDQVDSTV